MAQDGRHAAAALPPGNRLGTYCYRRLGGPQGMSERVEKVSPPPGFDPRTVQPAAIKLFRPIINTVVAETKGSVPFYWI
jgi:hypothetical protein